MSDYVCLSVNVYVGEDGLSWTMLAESSKISKI